MKKAPSTDGARLSRHRTALEYLGLQRLPHPSAGGYRTKLLTHPGQDFCGITLRRAAVDAEPRTIYRALPLSGMRGAAMRRDWQTDAIQDRRMPTGFIRTTAYRMRVTEVKVESATASLKQTRVPSPRGINLAPACAREHGMTSSPSL